MEAPQINVTLGTAGHIDHGKTALVGLLTGCETDRLKEEKERGMSIELGFAPFTLGGVEVGIVDVPGHEHFIKTMVAGATGIDAVIFVVAADDGVMPQTLEHLQILSLLGVARGVVALTKIDRVSPEQLSRARAQIEALLRGTFLEAAPVLPISNITGDGFDGLYYGLEALVKSIVAKRADGLFRMPVERAFSVEGFGTVVSGIPVSGSASVGDEIEILPTHVTGRIRGIETYGRTSTRASAGQCAALQFRHMDAKSISRGMVIAAPGWFEPAEWLVCRLHTLPISGLDLPSGTRVKFHTGTCDVMGRVYPFEGDSVKAGTDVFVQVNIEPAVVVAPRDRFVIRAGSPLSTMGGGVILDAVERRLKRSRPGVMEYVTGLYSTLVDDGAYVEWCTSVVDSPLNTDAVARRVKLPTARVRALLDDLAAAGKVMPVAGGAYLHKKAWERLAAKVTSALAEFHSQSPESLGAPFDALEKALGLERAALTDAISRLRSEGRIRERDGLLALSTHAPSVDSRLQGVMDEVAKLYESKPFAPPEPLEAVAALGIPQKDFDAALKRLVENGSLIRVADGLFFPKSAINTARERIVAHIKEKGELQSVHFKYLIDTTRKYAIPLLDYFDKTGLTLRINNTRYLKPQKDAGK